MPINPTSRFNPPEVFNTRPFSSGGNNQNIMVTIQKIAPFALAAFSIGCLAWILSRQRRTPDIGTFHVPRRAPHFLSTWFFGGQPSSPPDHRQNRYQPTPVFVPTPSAPPPSQFQNSSVYVRSTQEKDDRPPPNFSSPPPIIPGRPPTNSTTYVPSAQGNRPPPNFSSQPNIGQQPATSSQSRTQKKEVDRPPPNFSSPPPIIPGRKT